MYANKIIEDLSQYMHEAQKFLNVKGATEKETKRIINTVRSIKGAIQKLLNSIKFTLGNQEMKEGEFQLFQGETMEYRLPYNLCYFDYAVQGQKLAALIEKQTRDEPWAIALFNYVNNEKHWSMLPHIFIPEFNTGVSKLLPLGIAEDENQWTDKELFNFYAATIKPVINFVRLLNCKNIETRDIHPPAKLNKKREKQGKLPIFTYKTLHIKVPGNKKESDSNNDSLNHNRIHLCRGHFKFYTKEKPLLGKHTGLYWWEPHVRGQNKDGVVIKDYKVLDNT